ncbi:hypothetical protein [Hymenobacter actinosclerus]|uniref:Uncharacterized protein n=1 Tax=Hymenobacter actinosclerus TaxID=82805 RepID=A0A1H9ZK14_9BACT|nr:hypothetical protein [Hymenobacter actinosclerus]SES81456.1 hypothetical protein SAMN04487998_0345 [Hymenobacter actinosclerus]
MRQFLYYGCKFPNPHTLINDTQRAKLAMLQATLAVLDQHADLYATNQALGKAHD